MGEMKNPPRATLQSVVVMGWPACDARDRAAVSVLLLTDRSPPRWTHSRNHAKTLARRGVGWKRAVSLTASLSSGCARK
jgi:hypothetical protein